MKYFTNNPLERMMMQKPKAAREDSPPALPRDTSAMAASASGRTAFVPATVT